MEEEVFGRVADKALLDFVLVQRRVAVMLLDGRVLREEVVYFIISWVNGDGDRLKDGCEVGEQEVVKTQ